MAAPSRRKPYFFVQRGNGERRPWNVLAAVGVCDWYVVTSYATREAAEAAASRLEKESVR